MVALLVLVGLCGFYFINTGSKNNESTDQAVTVQQLQELANSNQRPKKGLVWITKTTRIEGRSLFVEGSFVNNHEMTATGIKDAAFEIVLLDGQGKTIGKRTAEIDGIRFERKVSTGNAYETTLELPDILKESDGKVISTVIIPKEINWSAIKPQ